MHPDLAAGGGGETDRGVYLALECLLSRDVISKLAKCGSAPPDYVMYEIRCPC